MITQEEAGRLVYARINAADPMWKDKPEMIITRVDNHVLGWVVHYTSRPWRETGDIRHAIAGNGPFLVSREDGSLWETGSRPPFEDQVAEAADRLRAYLESRRATTGSTT